MEEQRRYHTKQQELILGCLIKVKDRFSTVEQLMEQLRRDGIPVGQTTVYRTLDRLTEDGMVMKIPSVNGSRAQYRYMGGEKSRDPGKLVCLKCGRIQPLECRHLDSFSRHIFDAHEFEIDQQYTALYGYCSRCRERKTGQ